MNIIPRSSLLPSFLSNDSIFDDFFPSLLSGLSRSESEIGYLMPRVDIEEEKDHYFIKADMPGIKKTDLNVEISNGMLTINGHYDEKLVEKEGKKVIRRERRSGSYFRSFNVGKDVTEKMITADFSDGVLKLKVPKSKETEPQAKRIEIL
jgi:HSP20 family protein